MQACIASLPTLDILVNNAGTNRPAPFLEATAPDFDQVMAINVRAAFFVAQAVARKMAAEERRGSIINISSQMGLVGGARRSVYCASKWAMEGFTKAAATELGPLGIRVNTICPTFIETPMTRPFIADSAFLASVLKNIKNRFSGERRLFAHDRLGPRPRRRLDGRLTFAHHALRRMARRTTKSAQLWADCQRLGPARRPIFYCAARRLWRPERRSRGGEWARTDWTPRAWSATE
jgi:NAD(P)-dependent dehydrogenase (short-subunit alcohol dehydrogenase family)